MALATLFVTLPFVVRELIPILEAMDLSEEEAARTMGASDWEVFWNVTLPNIRWGLLYGVILTNAVRKKEDSCQVSFCCLFFLLAWSRLGRLLQESLRSSAELLAERRPMLLAWPLCWATAAGVPTGWEASLHAVRAAQEPAVW
jgi:hypothetical protein